MKKILLSGVAATVLLASCSKDATLPTATKKQEIPYTSLSTASDYFTTFIDENAQTTVDFSGQTSRISMMSELDAYMKKGTTESLMATKMQNMFEHKNSPFADPALNDATSKVIATKTALSFSASAADVERKRFIGYFNELERVSALHGQTAEQGKAGLLGGKRLVDEKGFEYNQFVSKGLIGALMLDEICNIYLGTDKQSADNTEKKEGKNYTALEHNWDEAYGYLTANSNYPQKGSEKYLGEYVRQGASVSDGGDAIFLSLLTGRAAIVNDDMAVRDEQITNIRTALEKAVAVVATSYINKTINATDDASRFHALSEAIGFIYSLRYAYNPKVNAAKSDELMNALMSKPNGFWSLTTDDLTGVRDQLANTFGFDKNVVVNH